MHATPKPVRKPNIHPIAQQMRDVIAKNFKELIRIKRKARRTLGMNTDLEIKRDASIIRQEIKPLKKITSRIK